MSEQPPVACLRVSADAEHTDELGWRLEAARASAIETRDPSTMSAEQQGRVMLLAGFPDAATRDRARAAVTGLDWAIDVNAVDIGDDGWSAGWREFHQPVLLQRIAVLTPWMEPEPDGRTAIVIDPGRAFGTGGHATTRLVLEMLEQRSAAGREIDELLDVGTGSGVLAIAAVKLGAGRALAIDNDPEAVDAARENARRNRVEDRIQVRQADPGELERSYPLVLANIDLATFERCAADVAALVSTSGAALLSGLLVDQIADCLALWSGFRIVEQRQRDGWVALELRRRQ